MRACLAILATMILSGCTVPSPRQPPSPTFAPVWFSTTPQAKTQGYTINGVSVGGAWTQVEKNLDKAYTVERDDWRYQVKDPRSSASVWITVDDEGKVVEVWTNSEGCLEKDGRPLLRTHEPEEFTLQALGLPAGTKAPWLVHDGLTTVRVDGGPAVYSISLLDEAYRQSTLTKPSP